MKHVTGKMWRKIKRRKNELSELYFERKNYLAIRFQIFFYKTEKEFKKNNKFSSPTHKYMWMLAPTHMHTYIVKIEKTEWNFFLKWKKENSFKCCCFSHYWFFQAWSIQATLSGNVQIDTSCKFQKNLLGAKYDF